jgi:glycosyltransferase involved in cell wall biosynthesis
VIGRNEGERLMRCLSSIAGQVRRLVYVDSGSSDGSIEAARAAGAEVIELDLSKPFTAARARNAGLTLLLGDEKPDYVQFIDGDCELRAGWILAAGEFLDAHPQAAIAFGRLKERSPEASIYNRLCDREWDGPAGKVYYCGGIAMMRVSAIAAVGGFDSRLIAGEEPELCVRLRAAGWEIWRLAREMALHDAAIFRFGQWWNRARRGGYAFAEGMAIHGSLPERYGVLGTARALSWTFGLPLATTALAVLTSWAWLLLLAYPVQIVRVALRHGIRQRSAWEQSLFLLLIKVPESIGVFEYTFRRLCRRPAMLIEYK